MTYDEAKNIRSKLDLACKEAGDVLRAFPRNAIGLVPDNVRATAEYRAARKAYEKAFALLRASNQRLVKTFKKEILEERRRFYAA